MIRLIIFMLILFSISCSHTPPDPIVQEPLPIQPTTEPEFEPILMQSPAQKIEEPVAVTPVAGAVQSMQTAEKKMQDTLKLVASLQGDQILDCQENRAESFAQLQDFFGQACFKFDRYTFWFVDRNGKKIGVLETDGILKRCKKGYFTSYKRLMAYQENRNVLVETEFFMDSTKGELIVHRFRNGVRTAVETYVLAGF